MDVKNRDYGFDNIKVFLIVLVVLGHVLEMLGTTSLLGTIRSVIYMFHMPAFIFISGYFSKNTEKIIQSSTETCLLPFLIFNTIWQIIMFQNIKQINFFMPVYVFWYLLSLFFWRISIKSLSKIKGLVVLSILVGLYCGTLVEADRFLSISRTISFFPFFILGYKFDENMIAKIRNIPHYVTSIFAIVLAGLTIYLNQIGFIPVKMYEMIQSYESTNVVDASGVLQRLIIYLMAFSATFILINLFSKKKKMFSFLGQHTICIYLLSSFIIEILFYILKMFPTDLMNSFEFQLLLGLIITIVTIAVTGNQYIYKVYQLIINKIYHWISKT